MSPLLRMARAFWGFQVVRAGFGLVGVLVGALFLVALAAGPAAAASWSAAEMGNAAPPVTTAPPPTTPPGATVDFNKGNKDADAALAQRKLVLAGISAVLLVIVYFGHKAKYRHFWRLRKAPKVLVAMAEVGPRDDVWYK